MRVPTTVSIPVRALFLWLAVFAFGATISLSAAADRVVVRGGIHENFGRLVFDWTKKVGFRASVANKVLSIRFDRTIDPNFGNIAEDLDTHITGARLAADKRTVLVSLKKNYEVRTSTVGNRVVIDLLNEKTAARDGTPETSSAGSNAGGKEPSSASPGGQDTGQAASGNAQGGILPVRTGHHENYGRLVFGWPRKVGFEVQRQGQNVTIRFESPARLDIARLRHELPRQISAANLHPSDKGLELGLVVPPDAQLRYFHNNTDVVFDVVTKREDVVVRRMARRPPETARSEPDRNRKKKARPPVYPFVSVDANQHGRDTVLKFNWREPVSATVFRRGSSLWIHFDRPARLDMGPLQAVGNSRLRDAEQTHLKDSVHLRLPVSDNVRTEVRRAGTVWVVELGPGRKRAVRNIPLSIRQARGGGTELLIKTDSPGAVSVIRDEAVGDAFYAVPVPHDGRGIGRFRLFPDFELLQSAQGVAIRPLNDSLRVTTVPAGVLVSKPGGLNLSPAAAATIRRNPGPVDRKLLDFAAWRRGPVSDYQKIEHELVDYIVHPNGRRRNAARLGLARFYAAYGMGAEAIGVINILLKDRHELLGDPRVRALRGIANYLMGHYAEADADLSHPSLAGIRELYPWRAGIAAARGDWAGAYRLFVDTDVIIATLPSEFAVKLGLLAAEAALSVKEKEIAEARLHALESLPAADGQLDQLAYLNGHLYKLKGETARALADWDRVATSGVRPSRAKAAFARINTLLESGAIKVPEAIDKLEKLQFAWRNSVFEFDLLSKLGDLYAQRRNLRSALVTLRRAVTLFKNIKGSQGLTKKMRDLFRKFYLDGEADQLQPVVALGLYNEFRELTPPGEDGDRMIRGLAERLIKVDLLEDAAKLLDHQVRFRLKGVQRARTGARLAEILLLDAKPQDALTALSASDAKELPAPLSEKRRHLEAAALMDSHRYDEALSNIAEDFTAPFDRLRAQIYWRAGKWRKASRVLARLTGNLDPDNLTDRDAEMLLRRAIALGLASDFDGMEFLRERFGSAMEKSKEAASFKAVAGGKLLKPRDFAALARRAGELDTFGAFMNTLNGKSAKSAAEQTATLN